MARRYRVIDDDTGNESWLAEGALPSGSGNVSDGGNLTLGMTFPPSGLKIKDADTHLLTLECGNLTGNRTLDIVPDGNYTFNTLGNATIGNQFALLPGNFTTTSTTESDVSDGANTLQFYAEANASYSFAIVARFKGATASDGHKAQVTKPTGATGWALQIVQTAAGSFAGTPSIADFLGSTVTQTSGLNAANPGLLLIWGFVQTGSTAGWCTLKIGSETGGSTTIYEHSYLTAERIE